MNLLVVGNGGREHALAWRLAQSDRVTKVFVAPGNAGTALTPRLENLPITDIDQLIEFVKSNNIAFTQTYTRASPRIMEHSKRHIPPS